MSLERYNRKITKMCIRSDQKMKLRCFTQGAQQCCTSTNIPLLYQCDVNINVSLVNRLVVMWWHLQERQNFISWKESGDGGEWEPWGPNLSFLWYCYWTQKDCVSSWVKLDIMTNTHTWKQYKSKEKKPIFFLFCMCFVSCCNFFKVYIFQ